MLNKICKYISHLEGIQVLDVHESGSHYFKVNSTKIRVSDHLPCTLNAPKTMTILCAKDMFTFIYGNKLIPIREYRQLQDFLRNFVMFADIFTPVINEHTSALKQIAKEKKENNPAPNTAVLDISGLSSKQQQAMRKQLSFFKTNPKKKPSILKVFLNKLFINKVILKSRNIAFI